MEAAAAEAEPSVKEPEEVAASEAEAAVEELGDAAAAEAEPSVMPVEDQTAAERAFAQHQVRVGTSCQDFKLVVIFSLACALKGYSLPS